MPRRPSANQLRTRRREHARQRVQAGAELTPDERQEITRLLAKLGYDAQDVAQDLAEIEYSVAHYWHVWHLMPDGSDVGRRREGELRWLLTGLTSIWVRRMGKPYQPRASKRGTLWEFVERVAKIADPYVTPTNVTSILRQIRLIEFRKRQKSEAVSGTSDKK
jgi:hypothetical protein